ncbi:hypothetical protein NtRootA1_41690 [Arthrobacter sp. NtRootA1]|nr:hypothetical protein NtRootA1_41690 [Arthrobacter sp. NtRootA1]
MVSLGGRLVTGGTATGEQLLSDLRNFVGHDAWSPEIRLSGEVSNAPLAGALLLDRESGYLVQGRLAFPGASTSDRDQFVSALQAAGVPINRAYPPLFELPAYGRTPEPGATFEQLVERCPNAVLIGQTGFSIHHRALLSGPDDLQRVAQMIDEAVQSVRKNRQ